MDRSAKESVKIQAMFSSIAHRYDFLNRLLSLGRDRYWRKFAVNQLPEIAHGIFLDVAAGTGDVALEIARIYPPGIRVIGVDFSEKMLEIGRLKVQKAGLDERIRLQYADATSLPFDDNAFDGAIIAFGIRNVQDYKKGISEMVRVTKQGGNVVILEFTQTENSIWRLPITFYLKKVLPFIGETISGNRGAYKYLPASMLSFVTPEELKIAMQICGLQDVRYYKPTLGIVTVHVGTK